MCYAVMCVHTIPGEVCIQVCMSSVCVCMCVWGGVHPGGFVPSGFVPRALVFPSVCDWYVAMSECVSSFVCFHVVMCEWYLGCFLRILFYLYVNGVSVAFTLHAVEYGVCAVCVCVCVPARVCRRSGAGREVWLPTHHRLSLSLHWLHLPSLRS